MTAAQPAKISHANSVRNWTRAMILVDYVAHRSRPHQKAVVVVMNGGVIFVPGNHKLRGVSRKKEILQIDVAQQHLLMPAVKCVQPAVGIFFQKMKKIGRASCRERV